MANHPIIQKEMDELLAKGPFEPWIGGSGFYSTLSNLITLCTYLLFKMPSIRQVWYIIQQVDYSFYVAFHDVYLHIPIVKLHYQFSWFVLSTKMFKWKVLTYGLTAALGVQFIY